MADTNQEVLRFVTRAIAFRKAHPPLRRPHFYTGQVNERGLADITWHGTKLGSPEFDDPLGRALASTIAGFGGNPDLHVMMNMFWEPLDFEVPVDPQRTWQIAVDTFAVSPHDIPNQDQRSKPPRRLCTVQGRSIVVLISVTG